MWRTRGGTYPQFPQDRSPPPPNPLPLLFLSTQPSLPLELSNRLGPGFVVGQRRHQLPADTAGPLRSATQVFKDPYLFDFLGTAGPRTERELEQGLVDHIQRFLLEMGAGFAFVGRQVLLEIGDSDFRVDLLFYHLQLRRFVVVELKAVPFSPAFVGQMNLYLSAVDNLMRHPDDAPTIGLLLCKGKDRMVVEYALRDLAKPLGVADWETRLVDILPDDLKGSLPTIEEIEAELRE